MAARGLFDSSFALASVAPVSSPVSVPILFTQSFFGTRPYHAALFSVSLAVSPNLSSRLPSPPISSRPCPPPVLFSCFAATRSSRSPLLPSHPLGLPPPLLQRLMCTFDGMRTQAQRDFFGGHGFKRIDAEGTFTARWEE
eukprot:6178204-Pleurochrysis_carterae.AAC.1